MASSKRKLICIADGGMEETGAHTSILFDYGRDPWGVADRRFWRRTFDVFPKATPILRNFALLSTMKPLVDVLLVYLDQKLDLFFQLGQLSPAKRDFILTFGCPALFPVESC